MSTQPLEIPEELNDSIELSPRNIKRIIVHLNRSEVRRISQGNNIKLDAFFLLLLPSVNWFNRAVVISVIALIAAVFYFAIPIDLGSYGLIGICTLAALAALVIQRAHREHKRNTRYARAIAALYSTKQFKPYRRWLAPLYNKMYGYFTPGESTEY